MFREFRKPVLILVLTIPFNFQAVDPSPQPPLENLKEDCAQKLERLKDAQTHLDAARARHKEAFEAAKQARSILQSHPDHLYGPEDELEKLLKSSKTDSSDEQATGNWPVRLALGLMGAGTALVIGSYWVPEIPPTRADLTEQSPEELYAGVKRKYRVLDDEDDI